MPLRILISALGGHPGSRGKKNPIKYYVAKPELLVGDGFEIELQRTVVALQPTFKLAFLFRLNCAARFTSGETARTRATTTHIFLSPKATINSPARRRFDSLSETRMGVRPPQYDSRVPMEHHMSTLMAQVPHITMQHSKGESRSSRSVPLCSAHSPPLIPSQRSAP